MQLFAQLSFPILLSKHNTYTFDGYAINAVYQLKLEKEIGSIEVGKKADIVILDHNIFDIKPSEIHKTKVLMTMMNGNITFNTMKN